MADPDRSLTGGTWTIDTFIDGDAATNFGLSAEPTVVFGDDGSLSVFTSCNTGEGSYAAEGSMIVLSGVGYTEEVCDASGSAEADAQVQAVLADGEVSFEIEAARLTLTRGTLGLSATTE